VRSFSFAAACPPSGTGISAPAAPLPTLPVCHSTFAAAFGSAAADRKPSSSCWASGRNGGCVCFGGGGCRKRRMPSTAAAEISQNENVQSFYVSIESHWMDLRVASDGPAGGIGWACGSGQVGPRVGSLQMQWARGSGRVGWARGSRRMGLRVASDSSRGTGAVGIGWACGSRVALNGPAGRVG
jgi:hypothetical protein